MSDPAVIKHSDGNLMPQLGLAVPTLSDDKAAVVVETALETGYRHIGTTAAHGNERGVGRAL
ncbi:hypothetical protein ACIQWR_38615 [Streptomyces sp. NPDC098789]|uniref:hypothetical protein n=1 Tax=Streptomyces sp. NPDC098789 TaxID=3366098 RepID=UPI003805F201